MKIERLTDGEEWNKYVACAQGGSFFHTLAWRDILEKTFRYKSDYLVMRNREGNLACICPFFRLKKMGFFPVADSLPESDICGPLMDEESKEDVAHALRDYMDNGNLGRDIAYVRVKTQDKEICEYLRTKGSTVDTFSGTMVLDLQRKPADHVWNTSLNRLDRKNIKRFEKDGVTTRPCESEEDLKRFYTLYSLNMRKRKVPPYPYILFKNIFDSLYPDRFNMLVTEKEGRCFGVGIFFIYPEKNSLYKWNLGMDKSVGGRYKIQQNLNWETIRYAEERGIRYINFGSTPSDQSTKVYQVKKEIGAEFIQDYTLTIPLNKKIFFAREAIVQSGRRIKKILPASLVQRISGSI